MKTFEEIRKCYIKRYPNSHFENYKYGNYKKAFADTVLKLEAQEGVPAKEIQELGKLSAGLESEL